MADHPVYNTVEQVPCDGGLKQMIEFMKSDQCDGMIQSLVTVEFAIHGGEMSLCEVLGGRVLQISDLFLDGPQLFAWGVMDKPNMDVIQVVFAVAHARTCPFA